MDLYCPAADREAAKKYQANKDCLLRPPLRRERQSSRSVLSIFPLRNYQLHLDRVKDIWLDANEITTVMADALAVLHWHTKIDEMDMSLCWVVLRRKGNKSAEKFL